MTGFILASASPRRLELLKQAGLAPQAVVPAEIDETPKKQELPEAYAKRVAGEKARAVAALHPGKVILAADTVVACGRRILPKAENERQARECLALLSGRRHRVHTAVAVADGKGRERIRIVTTHVKCLQLRAKDIDAYIASGEWRGKAGGYAIQGRAGAFMGWINGSVTGVIGLPLAETLALLAAAGVATKDDVKS